MHLSKFSWIKYQHNVVEHTRHFLHKPWAGGVVLLMSVVVAMFLANMEWSQHIYHQILTTDIAVLIHFPKDNIDVIFPREMNVEKFINDGLMVIFFFCVGLEIKREVLLGELSSRRKAILPVMAAVGGMILPALIYASINHHTTAAIGWGIPMATDIAFAIGILTLLGSRVPVSLKIFLTALAIADDLGAILIIALFYGGDIDFMCIGIAVVIMLFVLLLNRLGEKSMIYYVIPSIIVWSLFYYSGVHATISGVAMAMLIPTTPRYSKQYFAHKAERIAQNIDHDIDSSTTLYHLDLRQMWHLTHGSIPMSVQLEAILTPFVTFAIMPIFALVNAGVVLDPEHLNFFHYSAAGGSIGVGIFLGLVLGKPLGITLMSWLAVKSNLAEMPSGASWRQIFAVGCLGGIGFTMSIFIDTLAFMSVNMDYVSEGKISIIVGSITAALIGTALFMIPSKSKCSEK